MHIAGTYLKDRRPNETKYYMHQGSIPVYDDFAHEDKMNMNYSLDGLHLNDLGYNILNVRLSKEL